MLKKFCLILSVLLIIPYSVYASDNSNSQKENTISASCYVVMDSDTNEILFSSNENRQCSIASTTKILTCLIACESGKLNNVVEITSDMLNTEGSMIYLNDGDKITLNDLVKGALLASGNDAANAIAIYLGGSLHGFCDIMNIKAKSLNMNNSYFATPSGLDENNHHSTAKDMALLSSYAIKNKTFSKICCLKSAKIKINNVNSMVYNHNRLLSYSNNFIGMKTGFTQKAGRCLVSAYRYKGNVIICVTLNDCDDWQDHKTLVNMAKAKYVTTKDTNSYSINVVGGINNKVNCQSKYSITTLNKVNVKTYYYPFVYAPVNVGDIIGKQVIYKDNKIVKEVPIKALEGVQIYGKE